MKIANKGDLIQWTFESDDYPNISDKLKGKTFKSEVAIVFYDLKEYGVYPSYGMDLIPFEQAKILKK